MHGFAIFLSYKKVMKYSGPGYYYTYADMLLMVKDYTHANYITPTVNG